MIRAPLFVNGSSIPIWFFMSCFILSLVPSTATAAFKPSSPMPVTSADLIEEGRLIYVRRCSFCHGLLGDGNGPTADYLDPRPRDFTLGIYKFRTTQSGELPTNEDLFRTISRGLTGTAMQAFDDAKISNGLSEDERWAVIAYIKTFAPEFDDPELDPITNGMVVDLPETRAPYNAENVSKGEAVFEHAKCWECHGRQGRGNGQKAFDREDDWGFPIRIRNVTHPWKIKAGDAVEDIYMRFSTGILGTPMPSFVEALDAEERWLLAIFIKSLQHQRTEHQVMAALAIDGDLPSDPLDAAWQNAAPMDVRLAGQVVAPPRWQNPSIDMVTLRTLYNSDEIAFLAVWDDPFEDRTHDASQELDTEELTSPDAFTSYVAANDVIPRQLETFRDSLALQFMVKPLTGTKKPHFLRGDTSNPVNLWTWMADKEADSEPNVVESVARGWKQNPRSQPDAEQQVTARALWADGRWHLVMKRARNTADRNDPQFNDGVFVPLAVNAWDGSNGEHGMIMSVSSWYYVALEAPTPLSVYGWSLLAFLGASGLGVQLRRRARRQSATGEPT